MAWDQFSKTAVGYHLIQVLLFFIYLHACFCSEQNRDMFFLRFEFPQKDAVDHRVYRLVLNTIVHKSHARICHTITEPYDYASVSPNDMRDVTCVHQKIYAHVKIF